MGRERRRERVPAAGGRREQGREVVTGRRREPRAVGAELADLLRARGWDGRLAAARVVARWPEVVGEAVAAHCQPSRLEDGTLHVVADSAAWATQLTYLQGKLLDRLAAECGHGLVRRIQVRTNEGRPRR
jgi:predicted nucleic acid-binding Zn ribbon protein